MRAVFAGTASFAVPALRALVEAGHDVALVVTQPDRPGNRGRLTAPAVKQAAVELGLTVFQPERIREAAAVDRVAAAGPEVMVVVAYGQIIPAAVLAIPRRGVLNIHGSLLPRHRGAAPVAAAILAGDPVTGVTIMQMDEQLDHGPVLATREVEIAAGEDAPALTDRLAVVGAGLLVEVLQRIDSLAPSEQDHAQATVAPKLGRADGELDWNRPATEIDRALRAFRPWPGITLPLAGGRVKVLRGRAVDGARGEPGQVLASGGEGVLVAAAEGAFLLEEVQQPGGRPVPARALVRP